MSPPGLMATLSPRCTTTAVTPETLIRDEYIARMVASAPPLSGEQRDRLAVLLRPASVSGGRAA